MNGMQMLLKQLGIEPEKVFADFEVLRKTIVDKLNQIDGKLERIETKVDLLMQKVDPIAVPEALSIYGGNNNGESGSGTSSNG